MARPKNYDLIPLSHRCCTCDRNKEIVNFYVEVKEISTYVRAQCNRCKNLGIKLPKNTKRLLLESSKTYDVKYDIKHQIDMYFKGLYND